MRVLYLCPGLYQPYDGIWQKVKKRTQYWTQQGVETKVFSYNEMPWWERACLMLPLGVVTSIAHYILFSLRLLLACCRFKPDIIYTRHFLWPYFLYSRAKLVLEVNGRILEENRDARFWWKILIKGSVNYYNRFASGLVLVSEELGGEFYKIPAKVTMPNSILATSQEVLSEFNERARLKERISQEKAICFMATRSRSFYDVAFIAEFVSRLPEKYRLLIIGDISPTTIGSSNLGEVEFLGKLSGQQLKKIVQCCSVAIGVTDFYPGMKCSSLKVRTYLEYGVPVLSSDFDIDFDNSMPFYCGVPYEPGKKDAQKYADALQSFLDRPEIKEPREIDELPEQIAAACLDRREAKMLDFFARLLPRSQ